MFETCRAEIATRNAFVGDTGHVNLENATFLRRDSSTTGVVVVEPPPAYLGKEKCYLLIAKTGK